MPFSCEFPPLWCCWACLHFLPPVGLVVLSTQPWSTAPPPPPCHLISILITHTGHGEGEQHFLKLWGGRAGHNRPDLRKWSIGLPDSSRSVCCLILWSFWLVTFVRSFQQLAKLFSPVSCLFLSLARLTTFLYTFAPAHLSMVEFRSQCTSLSPCGQHLQPLVFPIWKGLCNISDFPKQGQFLSPNKIQVPALKIPFPSLLSIIALSPLATIITLWDRYYYYYPILQLMNPRLKEIS